MPRFSRFRSRNKRTVAKISWDFYNPIMASKGTISFEKMSKFVESLGKRSTQTDLNDRNDLVDSVRSQQKIQSLKLMVIVYESLMNCRNDKSGNENSSGYSKSMKNCDIGTSNFSQRVNGISRDYNAVVRFGERVSRFAKGEENSRLQSIFKGYYELVQFGKRVSKPESIFIDSYNQLVKFSRRLTSRKYMEKVENDEAMIDPTQTSGWIDTIKKVPNNVTVDNIYSTVNWFYEPVAAWATKEQAYQMWKKGTVAQTYIMENTVQLFENVKSLKDVDREAYEKSLHDLYDLWGKAISSDLPKLLSPACLIGTLHALAEAHVDKPGGDVVPTVPNILLDAVSILLEMSGFECYESEQVIMWLRKLAHISGIETLMAIIFIQVLSVVKDVYEKDGKTLDDVFAVLCGKLGAIEKTKSSITDKMYQWWKP